VKKLKISPEELKNAAWDARIELTAIEEKELQEEVQDFINQAKQLQEINLEGTAATYYGLEGQNILREDIIRPSLPLEASMANAPDTDESCFLVPRIIEE
jgi:aspartyl-tRNA(Asn)/glutamyl-tRNA(Gln) amidotransferase subunit C